VDEATKEDLAVRAARSPVLSDRVAFIPVLIVHYACAEGASTRGKPMAARCPQCSTRLAEGVSVCPNCGFNLAASAAPPGSEPSPTPRQPEVKLTIPAWVTVDWRTPATAALLTIVIGIALQYLVALLLVVSSIIASPGDISWAEIARIPPSAWLTFNLGVRSVPFLLTGVLWIRFSVRRSSRVLARDISVPRNKVLETAAKFAIAYAFIELATAIGLKSFNPRFADGLPSPGFFPWVGAVPDPAGAFFFGLLIGFLAGVYLFTVCAGRSLREIWPIRIETQVPATALAVWRGTITALRLAIPSMTAFLFVAFILTSVSEYHASLRDVLALIPTMFAAMVLWTGVDTGFLGFLVAMQLFLGTTALGLGFLTVRGDPAWIYSGIAIPFVALFIAGMRTARATHPETAPDAAKRGALISIPLSILCLIFASLHSGELTSGFVGRAFLVPFLWGAASAAGAFFEVVQHTPEQPVPELPA
jgi:hypothetical protein